MDKEFIIGKNPAFQFYPNDWSRDLEEHPLEIEGAWIRICCKLWWAEKRGRFTRTMEQWSKILRVPEIKVNEIFDYINLWRIGEISRNGNGDVTVMSRRMIRDEKDRELNMLRQRKHRSNVSVTPIVTPLSQRSSSSSSSSSSNKKKIYKRKVSLPDEEWIKELQLKECYSHLNVNDQFQRCLTYFETIGKEVSRRRFIVWLNDPRNKKPMQVIKGPPTDPMDRRMWEIEQLRRQDGNSKPA